MLRENKGFRRFLIIMAIFIVVGSGLYVLTPHLPIIGSQFNNTDYIAVLYIEGVISGVQSGGFMSENGYNHGFILSQIEGFINDDYNQGLVVFINSPGGAVYETDEVYLKLLEYKEKTGCPVYISMGSTAASGGYYISTAGDQVFANRNTITGSLGVTLGTFYDISDFLEQHGIKTVTLTAGKNKAMGSMTQPMNEERKAIFQSILDESYDQFVEVIHQGRGIKVEDVRELADGRIYTAKQALDLKLIDGIGTLDETIDILISVYELEDCEVLHYWYEDDSFFSKLKGVASVGKYQNSDMAAVLKLLDNRHQLPIGYICDWGF